MMTKFGFAIYNYQYHAQPIFTCLQLTMETTEQCVKSIQI